MAKTPAPRSRKLSSVPPTPTEAPATDGKAQPSTEDRQRRIAERAYQIAERRGFTPGAELEDWLAAEREIDDESRS